MKGFLISVLASLVAAWVLYISPALYSFFEKDKEICLTVDIATDDFGDLNFVAIFATNVSKYSFSPLHFSMLTDGNIIRLGIIGPNEKKSYTPKAGDQISKTLDAGDSLSYKILIENGSITNDIEKLFSGNYSYIDSKGRVKAGSIKIQSFSERQLKQYMYVAKWAGFIVIIFMLCMVGWVIYQKFIRNNSQEPQHD